MRIRTIRPEFFKDEEIADLKPVERLLFIGLWCMADRRGRLENRPRRIKAEILPYDSVSVEPLLDALAARKFIVRYHADGKDVIQIRTFEVHQRIIGKEAETESKLPGYNGETTGNHPGSNGETTEITVMEKGMEYSNGVMDGPRASPPYGIPIPLTLQSEAFSKTWSEWVPFRVGLKAVKNPKLMFGKQLDDLACKPVLEAIEMLNQSMRNGWQGLFEVKSKPAASPSSRHQSASDYRNNMMVVDESLITDKDRQYMELAKRLEQ